MSGVDFHPVAKDTAKSMVKVVNYILGLNISDADKRTRLSRTFNLVGSDFYTQMFNANSELFDSTAIGTTDYNDMTEQIDRLTYEIVRSYNEEGDVKQLVASFYDSALGNAQNEAFRDAISLDKHPTLTRTMVGETCEWCQEKAGVHVNPEGDLFARHAHCDCLFVVSGYKSRNGILTNYRKEPLTQTRNGREISLNDVFRDIQPGEGSVRMYNDGPIPRSKEHEKEISEWLLEKVGGEYTILRESRISNRNMPDDRRNHSELIEIKHTSTINGLKDRTRHALKQLDNPDIENQDKMTKIFVLDVWESDETKNLTDEFIVDKIKDRVIRSVRFGRPPIDYIIIKRGERHFIMRP